jgi:hypothetical protein
MMVPGADDLTSALHEGGVSSRQPGRPGMILAFNAGPVQRAEFCDGDQDCLEQARGTMSSAIWKVIGRPC